MYTDIFMLIQFLIKYNIKKMKEQTKLENLSLTNLQ